MAKKVYYVGCDLTPIGFVHPVCRLTQVYDKKEQAERCLRVFKKVIDKKYHSSLYVSWDWDDRNDMPYRSHASIINNDYGWYTDITKQEILNRQMY